MRSWWGLLFGIVGGLMGAGMLLLIATPPRGEPISLRPAPTPAPIVVHILGAVRQPGVYRVAADSRVEDAIQAAGGLRDEAEVRSLNLAARLRDGDQLRISFRAEAQEAGAAEATDTPADRQPSPSHLDGERVDINRAAQPELETLPGIGPATAEKIIAFRTENGPFQVIEDILNVSGIGPATFDQIKDLITVGDGRFYQLD